MTGTGNCRASELALKGGVRAIRLENELLAVTILPDKGADIYELIYKPRGLDVLWKSPWGLKAPGRDYPTVTDSQTAWLEVYEGGWQEIFPNGGDACPYRGVELNFHGEASLAAWDFEINAAPGEGAEVHFETRLRRSPFRLERTLRVEPDRPVLIIREIIRNEGGEALEYMWGHHPAYGRPFLGPDCRVDCGARRLVSDDRPDENNNPLAPGQAYNWPLAATLAGEVDLSRVPGLEEPRHLLAYFSDFESGWYALTNTRLGFGVGLCWPVEVFPYAWYWQEMRASPGFPWYKAAYVMALEPFSGYPSQGLRNVIEKTGTQKWLEPGASVSAELRAVFYESQMGVEKIEADGTVRLRPGEGAE